MEQRRFSQNMYARLTGLRRGPGLRAFPGEMDFDSMCKRAIHLVVLDFCMTLMDEAVHFSDRRSQVDDEGGGPVFAEDGAGAPRAGACRPR